MKDLSLNISFSRIPLNGINSGILVTVLCLLGFSNKAESQTVANLMATPTSGADIHWYSAPTGGTALPSNTLLVNGTTYYASQTVNGIESTERLAVVANITTQAAPVEGTHTSSQTQVVWNWGNSSGATGYKWGITDVYADATDLSAALTKTETGLACNTACTRYVWAYNADGCVSAPTSLTATTSACIFICGQNLTVNHVAGDVAPVTKTVSYGTINNIPGETSKCWITSNLGADHQAISLTDATEASAGWYWQFHLKQGFSSDGSTTLPSTSWNGSISDNSNWTPANDPCASELGSNWRIPTTSEWTNVDNSGNWSTWSDPWASPLKLHAAGWLYGYTGTLMYRGTIGFYWSSTQFNDSLGWFLNFDNSLSGSYITGKQFALTLRCLRE